MRRLATIAATALFLLPLLLGGAAAELAAPPPQALSGSIEVHARTGGTWKTADGDDEGKSILANPITGERPEGPQSTCLERVVVHVEAHGTVESTYHTEIDFRKVRPPDSNRLNPTTSGGLMNGDGVCVFVGDAETARRLADLLNGAGHAGTSQSSSPAVPMGASTDGLVSDAGSQPASEGEAYVLTIDFSFSDGCRPSGSFAAGLVRASDGASRSAKGVRADSPKDVCELDREAGLPALTPAIALGLAQDTIEAVLAGLQHGSPEAPSIETPAAAGPAPSFHVSDVNLGAETTSASDTLTLDPHPDEAEPFVHNRAQAAGIVSGDAEASVTSPVAALRIPLPSGASRASAWTPAGQEAPALLPRPGAPRAAGAPAALPAGAPQAADAALPPADAALGASAVAAAPSNGRAGALVAAAVVVLGALAWVALLALRGRPALRDDPLRHPVRRAMYDALREQPGSSLAELAARLGVHHTTARHHSFALLHARVIVAREVEGRRRFFPAGTPRVAAVAAARAALSGGTARAVYDAVAGAPGLRASEVATIVGTSHENACYHVRRLARLGLVETRDGGGVRRLYRV